MVGVTVSTRRRKIKQARSRNTNSTLRGEKCHAISFIYHNGVCRLAVIARVTALVPGYLIKSLRLIWRFGYPVMTSLYGITWSCETEIHRSSQRNVSNAELWYFLWWLKLKKLLDKQSNFLGCWAPFKSMKSKRKLAIVAVQMCAISYWQVPQLYSTFLFITVTP